MEKKETGGPAYPRSRTRRNGNGVPISDDQNGMTLRDYFAGQALNGILSNSETELLKQKLEVENPKTIEVWDSAISESAYSIADAMLKERTK